MGACLRSPPHGTFELGHVLARAHWGQGPVREAGRRLVAHVFETTAAERVYARIFAENERSRGAARSIGLRPEGILRSSVSFHGRRWDEAAYSVLRSEWPPSTPIGAGP